MHLRASARARALALFAVPPTVRPFRMCARVLFYTITMCRSKCIPTYSPNLSARSATFLQFIVAGYLYNRVHMIPPPTHTLSVERCRAPRARGSSLNVPLCPPHMTRIQRSKTSLAQHSVYTCSHFFSTRLCFFAMRTPDRRRAASTSIKQAKFCRA